MLLVCRKRCRVFSQSTLHVSGSILRNPYQTSVSHTTLPTDGVKTGTYLKVVAATGRLLATVKTQRQRPLMTQHLLLRLRLRTHKRPHLPWQILAFRRSYFIDPWNRFDIFIVTGTNLGLVTRWLTGRTYGSIATIIRTFRIGRVLRLVRGLESMAQLFNTLLLTLPSLGNVGALLFLQFFIYAVMGVQLFATVSRQRITSACPSMHYKNGSLLSWFLLPLITACFTR